MAMQNKQYIDSHKNLNGVVYGLVVLALFLGSLAGWQRYTHRTGAFSHDNFEGRIEAYLPNLKALDGLMPAGGFMQNAAATPRSHFVCPGCQSALKACLLSGCPKCPGCGQWMVRKAPPITLAAQTNLTGNVQPNIMGNTQPIVIEAGQISPHGDRGACHKCHTIVQTNTLRTMPVANAWNNPQQPVWNNVAAPAIPANATKPALIKEVGIEIISAGGTGAKITGVMGNSFASKAGFQAGDIIIKCNGAKIRSDKEFQQQIMKAPPEANAQITVMRNGRTRDLSVMVGEGEMEGFTPIK